MSPFTPLGDTLQDKIDKESSQEDDIVKIAGEVFQEMFGKDKATEARPLFLKNRTLTVSCSSSDMAQEIRENQIEIVERINNKLGKKEVDRIRYLA